MSTAAAARCPEPTRQVLVGGTLELMHKDHGDGARRLSYLYFTSRLEISLEFRERDSGTCERECTAPSLLVFM